MDGRRPPAGSDGPDGGRGHGGVRGDHGPRRRDRHGRRNAADQRADRRTSQLRRQARAAPEPVRSAGRSRRRFPRIGPASSGRRSCRNRAGRAISSARSASTGWRYYYLVALAVKVPLAFWLILAAPGRRWPPDPLGRTRLDPPGRRGAVRGHRLARLDAQPGRPLHAADRAPGHRLDLGAGRGNRLGQSARLGGLAAQAIAVASIHPYELSYFNVLAGGPIGGRRILSDSNLDWAQGLKPLAELQRERPELRDLTLYYFGDTEAERFGVAGRCYTVRAAQPQRSSAQDIRTAQTDYLAVSASLQWGPWATSGYFRAARGRGAGLLHRPTPRSRSTGRPTSGRTCNGRRDDRRGDGPTGSSRYPPRATAVPPGRRPARRSGGRGPAHRSTAGRRRGSSR